MDVSMYVMYAGTLTAYMVGNARQAAEESTHVHTYLGMGFAYCV